MQIKESFELYLAHVNKYRRKGTYLYYRKSFNMLIPILDKLEYSESSEIDSLFFENIIDYLLSNTTKKNSKVNDVISCIITAFNFCDIKYPKRYKLMDDTESFKALSEEELDQVLKYVGGLKLNHSNNLSWSLSICLFLDTGVRLSELLDMRFKNVDFDHNLIQLDHTKNGEKRYVFYNSLSRELMLKAHKKKTEYVICNYEKGTGSIGEAWNIFLIN